MIKKIIFTLMFCLFFLPKATYALVATPSASTEIVEMKDKIASKVAELAVTSEITIRGKVKSVNKDGKTFELQAPNNKFTVSFTEKTNYFWIKTDNKSKLTLKFENIEIDDNLVVTGSLIKEANQITAKTIYGKIFERLFIGKMTAFDKNNVEIKTLASNTKYTIDLEGLTTVKVINPKSNTDDKKTSDLKKDDILMVKGTIKDAKINLINPTNIKLIQN